MKSLNGSVMDPGSTFQHYKNIILFLKRNHFFVYYMYMNDKLINNKQKIIVLSSYYFFELKRIKIKSGSMIFRNGSSDPDPNPFYLWFPWFFLGRHSQECESINRGLNILIKYQLKDFSQIKMFNLKRHTTWTLIIKVWVICLIDSNIYI